MIFLFKQQLQSLMISATEKDINNCKDVLYIILIF